MSSPVDYAWLLPDGIPAGEAARLVHEIQARVQGGPVPLQLSLGIFPADLNDYREGLAALAEPERAAVIAAVEFAVELRPESIRQAALSLAGLVVRGTPLRAEDILQAVEPLLARHGSAPPAFRPADPLARRRLDVIAHFRSGVDQAAPTEEAAAWTRTVTPGNPNGEMPGHPDSWGQFRDLRQVGGGGFGVVYRAWDGQLHRDVALKLLRPGNGAHSGEAAILREARMMARVKHPNIVPVYGVDSHEGRVGLWSEWIEGATLATLVKTRGPMDPHEAAGVLAELCKAVSALHVAGMLHRDIKAENVMREGGTSGSPGRVLLMDFGLSHDPGAARELGGTPRYMAPELLAGGSPSVASDIYALGVLLYFLASGKYPVEGDIAAGLPASLNILVGRATAHRPEARYSSAEGLLQALAAFAESRPRRSAGKRSRLAVAAIAALLLSLSLFLLYRMAGGHVSVSGGAYATYQQGHALLLRRDKPGNLRKAAELFQKTIQADPKFALAQAELADTYWEQFRQTRETQWKDKAIGSANRALELDKGLAPIYVTLGRIHHGTGQGSLAMQDFRRALELDSRNADVYREMAQIYDAEGRKADAESAYQKAIDLNPGDWRNSNVWGGYLFNTGNLDQAKAQFGHALEAAPDNTIVLNNIGHVQINKGQFASGRQTLEKVISLSPDDPAGYRTLGYLDVLLGKFDEAAGVLGKAALLSPSDYANWANLAVARQFGSGGMEGARPAYLKAVELAEKTRHDSPSDPRLLANLGSYRAALGDREESLPLLRQAIALSPDEADIIFRVGEGYEILGLREKALPLINKALRLGYPVDMLRRSPELAKLCRDPGIRFPAPVSSGRSGQNER